MSTCTSSVFGGCSSCSGWNGLNTCGGLSSHVNPYGCSGGTASGYIHPIHCAQARYSCANCENGATLVIHKIVLNACGGQNCTPRTFSLRITGPSYPSGEIFTLRAGSCLELDEPLVIAGLIPGQYTIEEIYACPNQYVSTITGPVCGQTVLLSASCAPTVVTIVSRRRLCRLCTGCHSCSACGV